MWLDQNDWLSLFFDWLTVDDNGVDWNVVWNNLAHVVEFSTTASAGSVSFHDLDAFDDTTAGKTDKETHEHCFSGKVIIFEVFSVLVMVFAVMVFPVFVIWSMLSVLTVFSMSATSVVLLSHMFSSSSFVMLPFELLSVKFSSGNEHEVVHSFLMKLHRIHHILSHFLHVLSHILSHLLVLGSELRDSLAFSVHWLVS